MKTMKFRVIGENSTFVYYQIDGERYGIAFAGERCGNIDFLGTDDVRKMLESEKRRYIAAGLQIEDL